MTSVNAAIITQGYGYIDVAWNHSFHGEHPGHDTSCYYLYKTEPTQETPKLVAHIAPELTNFRYILDPKDRGKTLQLGVAVYDGKTRTAGAIHLLAPLNTIPNPPELLIVRNNTDNLVKLEWLLPLHKAGIKGYLVERSIDQIAFEPLGIASGTYYVDVGGHYKAPTNHNKYYYRVSAITYAGIQSSYITAIVNVIPTKEPEILTYASHAMPELPLGKYRLKARGTEGFGETPWVNIHTISTEPKPDYPEIPAIRLKAITPEGDTSLIIKTQSIDVVYPADKEPVQYRIRTVSADGVESYALLSTTVHHLRSPKYMINKSLAYIMNKAGAKLSNKGV